MDCQYTHKLALACGLIKIPSSRRTFDRRLKTISIDIKQRISTMGRLFVIEGLVDASITAIDSNLIKTKDPVWHKSSMEKGEVPHPGIDTDARWGYSHTKGWVFGYKLHLTCTTAGKIIVPLTAGVTTANVHLFLYILISSLFSFYLIWLADPGYDDKNLYEYSKKVLEIDLVCPVERYKNTSKKRLEIVCFYQSVLVRLSTAEVEYR